MGHELSVMIEASRRWIWKAMNYHVASSELLLKRVWYFPGTPEAADYWIINASPYTQRAISQTGRWIIFVSQRQARVSMFATLVHLLINGGLRHRKAEQEGERSWNKKGKKRSFSQTLTQLARRPTDILHIMPRDCFCACTFVNGQYCLCRTSPNGCPRVHRPTRKKIWCYT